MSLVDEINVSRTVALFVSPHLDDVALSCGGTVTLEARAGGALIVTVFAGRPPEALNPFAEFQHQRWGHLDDAVGQRRQEDSAAMSILGADFRWLDYPDAIYRGNLYLSDDELFGAVKNEDDPVADSIAEMLSQIARATRPERIYLPLAVGGHVDHQICSAIGGRLAASVGTILFYEDFPYAATPGAVEERVAASGYVLLPTIVPIGDAIDVRLAAITCYPSQLPTIFRHYGEPEEVVRQYARRVGSGEYAERFWRLASQEP